MLLRKQLIQLLIFWLPEQFDGQNDHADNEHEKTYPVDPMHISYPFGLRLIRFSQVEIL